MSSVSARIVTFDAFSEPPDLFVAVIVAKAFSVDVVRLVRLKEYVGSFIQHMYKLEWSTYEKSGRFERTCEL